jgi:hypothetical protein
MMVASMIVPCFIAIPLALRCAFTASKICLPSSFCSSRCRNARIVVSSGIRLGDQGDTGKAAHRRHLDPRILHRWIVQVVPPLQQMDAQQPLRGSQGLRLQRVRRRPPLLLVLG